MALWDHVQSRGADSGSGTSVSLAYSGAVTAGNYLVAWARIGAAGQTVAFSDDVNGSWGASIENFDSNTETFAVHYFLNTGSGTPTVTMTNTSSASRRWGILEYDAAGTTISLDQHTHATGNSATPNSGTVTTTSASEGIVGAACVSGTQSFTAGTGFTERQEVVQKTAVEDRKETSIGTYAADWTIGASDPWGAAILTFQSSGGAAATPVRSSPRMRMGVGR